jgi:hypothetical protein
MCGDLRSAHIGQHVTLFGWVASARDMGGMIFVDLRDRTGITQVRFDPIGDRAAAHEQASQLRNEWCVAIHGEVIKRERVNSELSTGEVEVVATSIEVFSKSKTPPFPIRDKSDAGEMLRLEYRYLDLRRGPLQRALITRSKVNQARWQAEVDAKLKAAAETVDKLAKKGGMRPEVRAERRWRQLTAQGEAVRLQDVLEDIRRRDARDGGRADAPMTRAVDAVLLDTSEMTIDLAADAARRIVEAARADRT